MSFEKRNRDADNWLRADAEDLGASAEPQSRSAVRSTSPGPSRCKSKPESRRGYSLPFSPTVTQLMRFAANIVSRG